MTDLFALSAFERLVVGVWLVLIGIGFPLCHLAIMEPIWRRRADRVMREEARKNQALVREMYERASAGL